MHVRVSMLCLILTILSQGQTPPRPTAIPGFYGDSVLLDSRQFTSEGLKSFFGDLMSREPRALVSVWSFPNEEQRNDFFPFTYLQFPYETWRQMHDARRNRRWAVAYFLSLRGSGILSIRNPDGTIKQVSIGGSDASGLLSPSGTSQILRAVVTSDSVRPFSNHAKFFIRTTRDLTPALGASLLGQIGDLPFDDVYLDVRNDAWFIDAAFPVFYPFQEDQEPLSQVAYWNSRHLTCWRGGKTPGCTVFQHSGFMKPTNR